MINLDYSKLLIDDFKGINASQDAFIDDIVNKKHSHAYLISGDKNCGKLQLCKMLSNIIVEADIHAENNIDVLQISTQTVNESLGKKSSSSISVDAVREMIVPFVNAFSLLNTARVVLVEQADLLTEQAQNALLKPVEEPQINTVFFLLSDDPSKIITTLKSRCQKVNIHKWGKQAIKIYLNRYNLDNTLVDAAIYYSNGLLEKAVYYVNNTDEAKANQTMVFNAISANNKYDIISFSAEHAKDKTTFQDELLDGIEQVVDMVIKVKTNVYDKESIEHLPKKWQWAAYNVNINVFTNILSTVAKARQMKASQVNWQACMDYMLAYILEASKEWQQ
ncbi:MAG: hypothetical protein GYA87_09715 [Christensenellaceae bacterium]|nr:hypothetical protein [Christensenellaceae bacterium]